MFNLVSCPPALLITTTNWSKTTAGVGGAPIFSTSHTSAAYRCADGVSSWQNNTQLLAQLLSEATQSVKCYFFSPILKFQHVPPLGNILF